MRFSFTVHRLVQMNVLQDMTLESRSFQQSDIYILESRTSDI